MKSVSISVTIGSEDPTLRNETRSVQLSLNSVTYLTDALAVVTPSAIQSLVSNAWDAHEYALKQRDERP